MPSPMHLSSRKRPWEPHLTALNLRAASNSSNQKPNVAAIVFAVIVGVLLCAGLAVYFYLRSLRTAQHEPTFLPGSWLKGKWWAWMPFSEKRKRFSTLPTDGSAQAGRSRRPSAADTLNMIRRPGNSDGVSASELSGRGSPADDTRVDRHTSVRSVMTLPAYSASARPTEQVIGREGERAGVDTVVEFPETVDEEEARREEEMEALYQIRRARRDEREERDERRRLRQEARERGDSAALNELRRQGRRARATAAAAAAADMALDTDTTRSEALIREHNSRSQERGRRVSSVSYMDLGIARHDGSRVRAGSNESDRRPLMDSAAQMGGARTRDRSGSATFRTHVHNVSTSSLSRFMTPDISDDDRSSVDFEMAPTPRSRSRARTIESVPGVPTGSRLRLNSLEHAGGGPATGGAQQDRTNAGVGATDSALPQYDELSPIADAYEQEQSQQPEHGGREGQGQVDEEAPPYESPTSSRAPRIPGIARLPSIQITPFTPDVSALFTADREWPVTTNTAAAATTATTTDGTSG